MDTHRNSGTSTNEYGQLQDDTSSSSRLFIGHSGRFRVLCVDDDGIGLQVRGEVLRQHDYIVTLEQFSMQTLTRNVLAFDLEIVDYQMPGMNDIELLYAMRARHAAYPIIFLSGALATVAKSHQRLFYRCLDKAQPVESLPSVISSYLTANVLPDTVCDGLAP